MLMERRVERFASVRAMLSLPLTPIQYLLSQPIQFIDRLKSAFSTHQSLAKENLALRTEQLVLKTQLQKLTAIEAENNYLKTLFQSSKKIESKTLIAELLAISSEPFVHQVVVDKGKNHHIYLGQPVLDAYGIMGQVVEVDAFTSRVQLISDSQSGIAVQNSRNGMRAVAVGDAFTGKLLLKYIPHTADVKAGDFFITSGLGGQYPAGYPVGIVQNIDRDPARQFLSVMIQPSARLESSRQVLFIWNPNHA